MRSSLLISFMLVSLIASSQNELERQVWEIIADSSRNFNSFKGSFKELNQNDSIYNTTITLNRTKANDIYVSDTLHDNSSVKTTSIIYRAVIADSVKKEKGKHIVDEWKDVLAAILKGSFVLKQTRVVDYNPSQYGWIFDHGNLSVSLDLFPYHTGKGRYYWVALGINYNPELIQKINLYSGKPF